MNQAYATAVVLLVLVVLINTISGYDCKTNHEIVKKRIDEEQEGILNE